MIVPLRDPNIIMKLSRLGSFHQSKLSFLRSFLKEFKDWDYKRDLFKLNKYGFGIAIYSFTKKKPVKDEYPLVIYKKYIDNKPNFKIQYYKKNDNEIKLRQEKKKERVVLSYKGESLVMEPCFYFIKKDR